MKCLQCKLDKFSVDFDYKEDNTLKSVCKKCCLRLKKLTEKNKIYHGESYSNRNFLLKRIGFKTYEDYRNSELWLKIKNEVYQQKDIFCFLCGKFAELLHHQKYDYNTLIGKKLTHIYPICKFCHNGIEFQYCWATGKKTKRDFHEVIVIFDKKMNQQLRKLAKEL